MAWNGTWGAKILVIQGTLEINLSLLSKSVPKHATNSHLQFEFLLQNCPIN